MNGIAVVSNRLPVSDSVEGSAGGLAVALGAALEDMGGTWVGWDGKVAAAHLRNLPIGASRDFAMRPLSLSQQEYEGYYLGFANRTLWPLFHDRTDLVHFDPSQFEIYRAVNKRFAKCLAPLAGEHELIWVHDYHLLFTGQELRRLGVERPLGFFLHVPFPTPDILVTLPCHQDLLDALSSYDLVGFQTQNDVRNFHAFILQQGGMVLDDGSVVARGRKFKVRAFSIGIDTRRFEALAVSKEVRKICERLTPCFVDRLGVIGVDRLDYTKGLGFRLRAFERMLDRFPELQEKAFLTQIAAPSREDIPEYINLKTELEALSGHINARYLDVDWTPVRYMNRTLSQTRLAALYRLSRVGLITPLKDGMNLVAKEYIASQNGDDPGVLVLSRFAGAAEQMDGAVLVNPYDIDEIVQALYGALQMPLDERRDRWTGLIVHLQKNDVHRWCDDFLLALVDARQPRGLVALQQRSAALAFPSYKQRRSKPVVPVRKEAIVKGAVKHVLPVGPAK